MDETNSQSDPMPRICPLGWKCPKIKKFKKLKIQTRDQEHEEGLLVTCGWKKEVSYASKAGW